MARVSFLGQLLDTIADRGREFLPGVPRGGRGDVSRLIRLCHDLLSQRGEASGVALAREAISHFIALDDESRAAFFQALLDDFGPNPDAVIERAEAYKQDPSPQNLHALMDAAEPPRQELFRRLNSAPAGTSFLVDLRTELLARMREDPALGAIDLDLSHLLGSWFNRGFLVLQPMGWDSPANILEKLMAYESVHEINGWADLRRRLEKDRRCYAFFHPALVDEPLIFVEVALLKSMADNVQKILEEGAEAPLSPDARTAIFYSINNCQRGLRGVSFGNFLIKQVVEELKRELPQLNQFATLSPIPGLRRWLEQEAESDGEGLLNPEDKALVHSLKDDRWWTDEVFQEEVVQPLRRLTALYLLRAKKPNGEPVDPVARFHLGNGARLERVNWMGDRSPKGLRESYGLMVNYAYHLDQIERNHEAFTNDQTVTAAKPVKSLIN